MAKSAEKQAARQLPSPVPSPPTVVARQPMLEPARPLQLPPQRLSPPWASLLEPSHSPPAQTAHRPMVAATTSPPPRPLSSWSAPEVGEEPLAPATYDASQSDAPLQHGGPATSSAAIGREEGHVESVAAPRTSPEWPSHLLPLDQAAGAAAAPDWVLLLALLAACAGACAVALACRVVLRTMRRWGADEGFNEAARRRMGRERQPSPARRRYYWERQRVRTRSSEDDYDDVGDEHMLMYTHPGGGYGYEPRHQTHPGRDYGRYWYGVSL